MKIILDKVNEVQHELNIKDNEYKCAQASPSLKTPTSEPCLQDIMNKFTYEFGDTLADTKLQLSQENKLYINEKIEILMNKPLNINFINGIVAGNFKSLKVLNHVIKVPSLYQRLIMSLVYINIMKSIPITYLIDTLITFLNYFGVNIIHINRPGMCLYIISLFIAIDTLVTSEIRTGYNWCLADSAYVIYIIYIYLYIICTYISY